MPGELTGGDDDICGFNSQLLSFSTQTSLLTSSNYPPTMSLVHITSKEQFSSLLGAAVFVVADCEFFFFVCPWLGWTAWTDFTPPVYSLDTDETVYADWCGPCKAIAPAYEQLASQLSRPGHIIFTKINVDEQQDVAKAYSITA